MKILLLCLVAAVTISGCTSTSGPATPQESGLPQAEWDGEPTNIVLAVSRDLDDMLSDALIDFGQQLYTRTDGYLNLRVEPSISPDAELLTGRAEFALLNKRHQFEFSPPLATTATPFLYHGYTNFLMRANSRGTMGVLEFALYNSHGLVPLAAFYQGASHLLIDFPPGGYHQFDGISVLASPYENSLAAFGRLVGQDGFVGYSHYDSERLESFILGEANAVEVSFAAFENAPEDFPETVHLIVSYHELIPVWLIGNAEFISGLPPTLRSAIYDLTAMLSNRVSESYRGAELEMFGELYRFENLELVSEFSHVRNRVFNTMPEAEDMAGEQRLARDLIDIMRRTG